MTKTILSTNLKEINGLKIVCKKCGANWFIPMGKDTPPRQCVACSSQIDANRIFETSEKIRELVELSKISDFDVIIETEQE